MSQVWRALNEFLIDLRSQLLDGMPGNPALEVLRVRHRHWDDAPEKKLQQIALMKLRDGAASLGGKPVWLDCDLGAEWWTWTYVRTDSRTSGGEAAWQRYCDLAGRLLEGLRLRPEDDWLGSEWRREGGSERDCIRAILLLTHRTNVIEVSSAAPLILGNMFVSNLLPVAQMVDSPLHRLLPYREVLQNRWFTIHLVGTPLQLATARMIDAVLEHDDLQADPDAPYRPAKWFTSEFGPIAGRLRQAKFRGLLPFKMVDGLPWYSVPRAESLFPDVMLPGALSSTSSVTKRYTG